MESNIQPRRAEGMEINEVADGYVVYDPIRDRVHYLNHTAVLIIELCTGAVPAGELPFLVQAAFGLPEAPVDEVNGCLDRLLQEGLIR
jgi:hypothetical protein